MKITILGSGASSGTPSIEGGWGACDPENPKNRRFRPSILVSEGGADVLIDTSPDLREQLLQAEVKRLDGVVLSHAHADHLHGIDDLRGINRRMNAPLDLWADAETMNTVSERFPYILAPLREGSTVYYKPTLIAKTYQAFEAFSVGGIEFLPIRQDHGHSETHGFRMGALAYTTDFIRLPNESVTALQGIETWIVGAFSWDPHPTHLHVDGVLELRDLLKPDRTVITHMSPYIDYATLCAYVPDGVEVAYDGMELEI